MRTYDSGDGDMCPQDPTHGRMWFTTTKRQWCPSARHTGHAFYGYDADAPKSGEQTQPPGSFTTTRDVVAARRSPRHQLGAGATE